MKKWVFMIALMAVFTGQSFAQEETQDAPSSVDEQTNQIIRPRPGWPPEKPVRPTAINERLASSGIMMAELDSGIISYRTHVNRTPLQDGYGVYPRAEIISFSYEIETAGDDSKRPVLFLFNGGPGSSSIWLHRTAFGPRKTSLSDSANNYEMGDLVEHENLGFLIDVADLVFVDPVGTGLSRTVGGADEKSFQDLRVDARAMCRFVENWMEAEDRADAPIYVAGASYGTLRAAGMASHPTCRDFHNNLRGLIFISGLLDLRLRDNDTVLKGVTLYPTIAATAWHRGLVDKTAWGGDRDTYLRAIEDFASDRLGPSLARSYRTAPEEVRDLVTELYANLGLSRPDQNIDTVNKAIANAERTVSGKLRACPYDTRADCKKHGQLLPGMSLSDLSKLLLGGFAEDLSLDTGFEFNLEEYVAVADIGFRANWDFRFLKTGEGGAGTNMAGILSRSFNNQRIREANRLEREKASATAAGIDFSQTPRPTVKIMVASGLYDSVTPYYAMQVALLRAGFSPEDFALHLYDGGHMMYLDKETGYQMADDIRSFIKEE